MLYNYLITAKRALWRYKGFSFINILGLSVGMAAFLLILQYIRYETSYDAFHTKGERIYRLTTSFYREGIPTQYAATFLGVGPAMKADFPEVEEFTRVCFRKGIVSYQNRSFSEENLYFADPGFLTMFSLQMQEGGTATFKAPNEAIISQSMAQKYFGTERALGKVIKLKSRLYEQEVTVKGVFTDLPANSHIPVDILVSVQTLAGHLGNERLNGWDSIDHFTYVLLTPGAETENLQAKLPHFIDKYLGKVWEAEPGLGIGQNRTEFGLQPLLDIHLHSDLRNEVIPNGNVATVRLLMAVATCILLLAWINYINLSTARAMERAKEVAVRKVIGASRLELVKQFFFESLLLNLCGIVLAFTMAQLVSPWVNNMAAKPFYVLSRVDGVLWWSVAAMFVAGTLFSGIYPAFVLSSFKPVTALKGKIHIAVGTFSLRKSLIVVQFAVAVLLLAGTYAVYRQMQFMRYYDLGMNIDQLLVVKAPLAKDADSVISSKAELFKNYLLTVPAISIATTTSSVPNTGMYGTIGAVGKIGTNPADLGYMFHHINIDNDFMRTYGIELLAGRVFSKDLHTDNNHLILSEAAIKVLGYNSPEKAVNQRIVYEGEKTIIGVIKDFHQYSVAQEVLPIILELRPKDRKYFTAKVSATHITQTLASIKKSFESVYPNNPFEYFFMDDHFAKQYEADSRFGQIFSLFSCVSIFIACLGLFGLVSYATVGRSKEIGVRKVLGASVSSIVVLLSRDFLKLVLLSNLIAWPLAYWGINQWLTNYAQHTSPDLLFLLVPSVIVLLISALTISYHTIHSARENPVKTLRDE